MVLLDQAKSTEEKMHDRRNRFLLREVSRTSDWAFPARSGFTTFCHRKVAPKVSAGHLCRDRTEVLTERAQKTALLRRKRLHRFDCGGSAKSASGLCVRLLNVVLHTHSWRSPGAVTSSATFAVRSRRPEACHVRTQTNDYHCAQRTTVSALHRRRNQIGRRFPADTFGATFW